jgi:hypothetical protein
MIDYKYSFVVNEMTNNLYALVMNCWIIDEQGLRVDIKSDIQTNLSLEDCFILAKAFANPE